MRLKGFFRARGMDRKTVLYLTVLIFSMLCGTAVLLHTGSQFSETIESHNQGILRSYANLIEERMQEIPVVAYELYTDAKIQELAEAQEITASHRLAALGLLDRFPQLLAGYRMVGDFYIYMERTGKILTPTGFYDAVFYYNAKFGDVKEDSYDEWVRRLGGLEEEGRYTTEHIGLISPEEEEQYCLYTRRDSARGMTCVIMIDNIRVEEDCIRQLVTGEGYVGLYGEYGEVLVENMPGSVYYRGGIYQPGEEVSVLTQLSMPEYHMVLTLSMPDTIFTAVLWNAYMTQRNCILCMIFLVGLSGTLFVYNYYVQPKNSLMAWMRTRGKKGGADSGNYQELQHMMDNMLEEREAELRREREVGERIQGENYLTELLRGERKWEPQTVEKLRAYHMDMPYPYAWIMICETGTEDDGGLQEMEAFLRHAVMTTFVMHTLDGEKDRKTVILNLQDKPGDLEPIKGGLESLILRKELSLLRISIGRPVLVEDMAEAYQKVRETAEYHFLYPDSPVLETSVLARHTDKYVYSQETESMLIEAATERQTEVVMEILHRIFARNFGKNTIELSFAKMLLYALLNTVYKVEALQEREEKQLYQAAPDRMITSCRDIREAKEQIEFIFRSLCVKTEEGMIQETSWRMKRIRRYLEDHYLENGLSLEQVADHFHITPQYLSGLFKKNMNENFLVYLTKRRLAQAKSLMMGTKLTLAEIATRSGFTNYLALARAFQKYEGETPGEYRRNHMGDYTAGK